MEPLSATAGVLTILEAGGVIAKGLKRLRSLKHAPDVLLALNNEVTNVALLIEETDGLLRETVEQSNYEIPRSLTRALERLKDALLDLESFLAYEMTLINTAEQSRPVRIDKSTYLHAGKRMQILRDDIRARKQDLGLAKSHFAL